MDNKTLLIGLAAVVVVGGAVYMLTRPTATAVPGQPAGSDYSWLGDVFTSLSRDAVTIASRYADD